MQKGKFIVLEGIDGSGKGTQIELLKNKLIEENIPFKLTREPSDGPVGRLIREEYLSGKRKAHKLVLDKLFFVDRLDHLTNNVDGILKILDEGINVISDRYYLSTLAHNTYPYVKDIKYYAILMQEVNINKTISKLLTPDITIVLDVPFPSALKRIQDNRSELSIYENAEKLSDIAIAYKKSILYLTDIEKENIVKIFADRDKEEVFENVWKSLQGILY